jgi:ATP-dependent Clp protease ATP-binding subunit ClpX
MSTGFSDNLICSFCGKHRTQVDKLIAGSEVCICNGCVEICTDILYKKSQGDGLKKIEEITSPQDIYDYLEKIVEGHVRAKKILSVIVFNHFKNVGLIPSPESLLIDKEKKIIINKSNVLIIGHTGTGKTLLASALAKLVNVPFVSVDVTTLTEAGYVGDDVIDVIARLYQASGFNKEKTERGIIYFDEIDKIASKDDIPGMRDVSGKGVQQALLKILDKGELTVSLSTAKKYGISEQIIINTQNILVIAGGAFCGLEKIISRRTSKGLITFSNTKEDMRGHNLGPKESIFSLVTNDDLIQFGFIAELIGRLPVKAALENLDKDSFVSILCKKENSLVQQYKKKFDMNGLDLEFTDSALEEIAKIAMKQKSGARGLQSIMEEIMMEKMFVSFGVKNSENISKEESPDIMKKKIVVDNNFIESTRIANA